MKQLEKIVTNINEVTPNSKSTLLHAKTKKEQDDYNEDTNFKVVTTTFVGQIGNGFINAFYFGLYILLQVNAIILIQKLDFKSILVGVNIFIIVFIMEFLLIYYPPLLMKWIPFWTNTFGRGVFLCFISMLSLDGFFLLGFITLMLSFSIMISCIFTNNYYVPPPIMNGIASIHTIDDKLEIKFEKEPERTIYDSIQLNDY